MAVKKCPECGGKVASSLSTCPHCGYELEPKTVKATKRNDYKDEVILRRDRPSTGGDIACVVICLFFVIAIVGIIGLIIEGIILTAKRKNNAFSKDIGYYNRGTGVITLYDYEGQKREYDTETIDNANFKISSGILQDGKFAFGYVTKGDFNLFKETIEQIKNGSF